MMADENKKDELDEVLGVSSKSESPHKLEDIDPIFAEKEGEPKKEFSDKKIVAEENTNVPEAGAVGAAVGYVANKVLPKVDVSEPKGMGTAKVNAEVSQKSVQRQIDALRDTKAGHTLKIDDALKELNNAKATADEAARKLAAARENAIKLNALPEPPPTVEVPKVGSTIPIDEGAMRHNTKMGNIVDYNAVRKGMTGTTAETQGLGRLSGYTQTGRIIVPQALANAPIYNAEQLLAQKQLAEAEAAYKSAQANANSMQAKWKGLSGSTPKAVTTAEAGVTRATERAAQATDKLKALEAVKPTGLQRAGAVVSKIPGLNILAGGLTGAEAMNAIEQAQKGNYFDATMSGMGAAGGALMMVPHPYAKVAGALLSAPPLAYQGYQAARDYFSPKQ
jgi:hypothetical protein